jgi:hypothetical protein
MRMKHASLPDLQTVYRFHYDARERYSIKLEAKYGRGSATTYASRGERSTLDKLRKREHHAGERVMAWLRANTKWDWYNGTSYHWLCTSLTEAQALSETAPLLPAEAASYGRPHAEYRPGRIEP